MQIKKLFLLLIFTLSVNHSHAQIMPEPGVQFLTASGLTLIGAFGAILISKVRKKMQVLQAIKNKAEKMIKNRGGKICETTDYHSRYCGTHTEYSTIKNWRLVFPDYPDLDDLHVISINWNKYLEAASEHSKFTAEELGSVMLLTFFSFVGAAVLYGDLLLNPPYRYRY